MVRNSACAALLAASLVAGAPSLTASGASNQPSKREGPREGMFLTARPGGLLRVSTGDWVFVPQDTGEGPKLRPMVILPSQTLSRLAAGAQALTGQAAGVVSGQVFVYRGREYLLPTAYRIIAPEQISNIPTGLTPTEPEKGQPDEAQPSDAKPADNKTSDSKAEQPGVTTPDTNPDQGLDEKPDEKPQAKPLPTNLENDPSVEELVRDLEARKTQPRALTPRVGGGDRVTTSKPEPKPESNSAGTPDVKNDGTSGASAEAAKEAPIESLPEGKLITSMRGRVTRTSEGELAFSRDGDSDSPTGGPMVLLPCQTLQSLEELTAWRGEALVLEVSGRAFEFENRRYLLPTMFVVQPPSETRPTQ
ncbi:MAG: hypothetical protein IT434_06820 [Phycisphaerales bacterium]|jgi:hypothetical protein|nr:hypothetical protein [Phycisphaerales bacterium]